jgi:hypothetical protein
MHFSQRPTNFSMPPKKILLVERVATDASLFSHHHLMKIVFPSSSSTHRRFYERELYPHTEHTCRDEFVLPAHLLPTKKHMTERCSSLVQFISFATIFTTAWQLSYWTARSAGLPDWLVTWHSQTRPITIPTALNVSSENIKVGKFFVVTS